MYLSTLLSASSEAAMQRSSEPQSLGISLATTDDIVVFVREEGKVE